MGIHAKTTTFPILIFFIAFQFISLSSVWAQSKRNNKKSPDYSIVFPQNKVNRIDITITADNWQKLNNNLASKFGKFNKGFMPGPPPNRMGDSINPPWKRDSMRMPPWGPDSAKRMNMPPPHLKGGRPPFPGGAMGPLGKMGPPPFSDAIADIFVPATITFQGKKWKNTGFRFKGNSSLMMSWSRGIKKMPFRLNFSKFGDSIPKVKKQRFFGFKELTFSNNIADNSFLHEKIASDLFREAGIKAPHTAFYEVYINYGEGLQYAGLYTTIEIVEDALLKNQFGSSKGNCYKPDGQAGSFANGSFNEKSFKKKTNKKKNDYNDVRKLYTVLHSSTRISNPALWKTQLDSIFDIPIFLKWLAINTTILNWDTYGFMPHNYYLYNNPSTEKLTWIPWDNNESLSSGKREELSLSLSEITEDWPLIRYLLDQPEYAEIYRSEILNFIEGAFENIKVKEKIETYYKLIYPYVIAEKQGFTFLPSANSFLEAKNSLIKHVTTRLNIAQKFIEQNINKDQENTYIDTTSFESSARHWYFISDAHNIIYPTPNQPRYRASEITKISDNILL